MNKRHFYDAAHTVRRVGISSPKLRVHSSSQWKILETCCVQEHGRFVSNNFKILFPSFGSRKMPQELLLSPWACFSFNNDVTENMFAFCLLCPLFLSLPHCPSGAIVAVYVICWLPYHARRLMYCYIPDDEWTE